MIFTPENAKKIMAGTKWVTRRVAKDGEGLWNSFLEDLPTVYRRPATETHDYIIKWQVGRSYAICPGRGKKAIGRMRITKLSREKLHDITDEDLVAEGIGARPEFLRLAWFGYLWNSIYKTSGTRWADNPEVFRIEFEVER